MSIRLNTTFSNANLPLASSLATQIKGLASLKNWYQADAQSVVFDGAIANAVTSFADLKGSADTLAQATAANKAILTPGKFGNYAGVVFDGVAMEYAYGGTFARTTDFSIALVFAPASAASGTQVLWSSFTSVSQRTIVDYLNNQLTFGHGAAQVVASGLTYGAGHVAILSATTSGATLKLRLDGGATLVATGGDNNAGTNPISIGSLYTSSSSLQFKGALADVLHFNADIIGSGDYAIVEKYVKGVYGIGA